MLLTARLNWYIIIMLIKIGEGLSGPERKRGASTL